MILIVHGQQTLLTLRIQECRKVTYLGTISVKVQQALRKRVKSPAPGPTICATVKKEGQNPVFEVWLAAFQSHLVEVVRVARASILEPPTSTKPAKHPEDENNPPPPHPHPPKGA